MSSSFLFRASVLVLVLLTVGSAWAESAGTPLYMVPRLDGITVDGKPDDWGARGLRIEKLWDGGGVLPAASGSQPLIHLGWNNHGLLVLVQVSGDVSAKTDDARTFGAKDSVEIYVGTAQGSPDFYLAALSPGLDPAHPELKYTLGDVRTSSRLKQTPLTLQAARTFTPNGYSLEVCLPWANLGLTPARGREMAMQVRCYHEDSGKNGYDLYWYPAQATWADSHRMHRLCLAQHASAPVQAAAYAHYERFRRVHVDIDAALACAGKTVTVAYDNNHVVMATLHASGDTAQASLNVPLPASATAYAYPLLATVAGETPLLLTLPDMEPLRQQAILAAEMRATSFVFTGTQLPSFDFVQPALMEDLLGLYTITTRYYDARFHEVKTAETPGRYGAEVLVTSERGDTLKRSFTLFRQPEDVNWDNAVLATTATLPAGLGIDQRIQVANPGEINTEIKWSVATACEKSEDMAILLAGLYETDPTQPNHYSFTKSGGRSDSWWVELHRRLGTLSVYPYHAYLPDTYATQPATAYPLVVMLHGSGERGMSSKVIWDSYLDAPMIKRARTTQPCIIVMPHCPPHEYWSPNQVNALIDDVLAHYRVDADRIYLTGMSMGGYGTWATAAAFPERFAAIAPICGGGDPEDAGRYQHLPTWAFHGALDPWVPLSESQSMVTAINAAGGQAKLTIYPDGDHGVWGRTYDNPDFLAWLLQQKRGK